MLHMQSDIRRLTESLQKNPSLGKRASEQRSESRVGTCPVANHRMVWSLIKGRVTSLLQSTCPLRVQAPVATINVYRDKLEETRFL